MELQGRREAKFKTIVGEEGIGRREFAKFRQVAGNQFSPDEQDELVRDLVNFLDYPGDAAKSARRRIGFRVLGFLTVFFVLNLLLKREYWKDIH